MLSHRSTNKIVLSYIKNNSGLFFIEKAKIKISLNDNPGNPYPINIEFFSNTSENSVQELSKLSEKIFALAAGDLSNGGQAIFVNEKEFLKLFSTILEHLNKNKTILFDLSNISKMLETLEQEKHLSKEVVDGLLIDFRYCQQLRIKEEGQEETIIFPKNLVPDINATIDDDGNTLLHKGVKDLNSEMVENLVNEMGADVNKKNKHGITPIQSLMNFWYKYRFVSTKSEGQAALAILKILLNKNANVNSTETASSSLFYAIRAGSYEAVELLLPITEKREILRRDKFGCETSERAPWYIEMIFDALESNYTILKLFKKFGANLNIRGQFGTVILNIVINEFPSYDTIERLVISHSMTIKGCEDQLEGDYLKNYKTFLIKDSLEKFNAALAKLDFLLELGADPSIADEKGDTPLHILLRKIDLRHINDANQKVISRLLEHGAKINAKNECGETPLTLANKYTDRAAISQMETYEAFKRKEQVSSLKNACLLYFFLNKEAKNSVLNGPDMMAVPDDVKEKIESYNPRQQ